MAGAMTACPFGCDGSTCAPSRPPMDLALPGDLAFKPDAAMVPTQSGGCTLAHRARPDNRAGSEILCLALLLIGTRRARRWMR